MKALTDALHWVFATEQKAKTMNDTVIDTVTGAQASVAEQPVVTSVTVPVTDADALIAQLKTFLVAAGYDVPVFDQLASAAKAIATK
jgi:hypothetical protein